LAADPLLSGPALIAREIESPPGERPLPQVDMSVPEARDEPPAVPFHRGNALRARDRADLSDEPVLNQDVNRIGGGWSVERDHPDLAQQQR
jgi:hypothetical protein